MGDVRKVSPLPCKGELGLWGVPAEFVRLIIE